MSKQMSPSCRWEVVSDVVWGKMKQNWGVLRVCGRESILGGWGVDWYFNQVAREGFSEGGPERREGVSHVDVVRTFGHGDDVRQKKTLDQRGAQRPLNLKL